MQTVVKHCEKCKSTGILIGLEQTDSAYCHDCILQPKTNSEQNKEKYRAWDLVRPTNLE